MIKKILNFTAKEFNELLNSGVTLSIRHESLTIAEIVKDKDGSIYLTELGPFTTISKKTKIKETDALSRVVKWLSNNKKNHSGLFFVCPVDSSPEGVPMYIDSRGFK